VTGFVKTHVLDEHKNEEVVSEICPGTSEDHGKASSDRSCRLRQLKELPEVVVVTCEVDVQSEETFLWTQQVSKTICCILDFLHFVTVMAFLHVELQMGLFC